jgi:hypothetical protein
MKTVRQIAADKAAELALELERQGIVTFHVANVQRIAMQFIISAIDEAVSR